MGKKTLKKKLEKNTLDNSVTINEGASDGAKKFGITLISVLVIFSLIFVVLNKFIEKKEDEKPVDYTEKLGYSKIMAQDTFDMPLDEYVVFFINGDEGKDEVNAYFQALSEGKVSKKVYVVDMAEKVNSSHIADDSEHVEKYGEYSQFVYNKVPTNSSEVQIYEYPTVIDISSGMLAGFYVGDEFYEPLGLENPNAQQQAYQ